MKIRGRSSGQVSMQLLAIMALLFAFISIFIWQVFYLAEKAEKGASIANDRQRRENFCFILGEMEYMANGALIIEKNKPGGQEDKYKIELVDCTKISN
jgi:hypothetical protein